MTDTGCQQCGENTFSSDRASSCIDCPNGKFSNAGSTSAENCYYAPCSAGDYMTDTGCQQCGENTFSSDRASSCIDCPNGKFSNAGSTSAENCYYAPCSAGDYMTDTGCQQCGENTFSSDGASLCTYLPITTPPAPYTDYPDGMKLNATTPFARADYSYHGSVGLLVESTSFYVDGGWSDYGDWSKCSVECDVRTQSKNGSCDNVTPLYKGADYKQEIEEENTSPHNLEKHPPCSCWNGECGYCPNLSHTIKQSITSYPDQDIEVRSTIKRLYYSSIALFDEAGNMLGMFHWTRESVVLTGCIGCYRPRALERMCHWDECTQWIFSFKDGHVQIKIKGEGLKQSSTICRVKTTSPSFHRIWS
ncbi:uncharacterized protein LOC134819279 [Bolinopsis microptera]|uniref:uncharacterized protein LOC134819279 n=1 Tax=Bolinopsis microptera TaxID=2820187 RepID=UPI00307B0515